MPTTWRDIATKIRGRERDHVRLLATVLNADDGKVFANDLIAVGVAHRSLELTKAFLSMLRSGNLLCAGALLRMQVDNILRLHAASLFTSGNAVLNAFLKEQPLSRLRAPDGAKLTDQELVRRVSKAYPWVPSVYDKTSGFIHFSLPAVLGPLHSINDSGRFAFHLGWRRRRRWRPSERLEAAEAFDAATRAVLDMIYAWGYTKARGGKNRPGPLGDRVA